LSKKCDLEDQRSDHPNNVMEDQDQTWSWRSKSFCY